MYFSAVSGRVSPRFQILTMMLDLKSWNILFQEVMISSKNKHVFICDLSDLTLQIIINAWWTSMNVGSTWSIACNNCRHAPLWWFYLHRGIDEICSSGIICIVCDQVLRHPSEHDTSSMGKCLLAQAHIAKLNKLTKLEVTNRTCLTVDETVLAILRKQGCRGITIVSSQWKFIFDIQVWSILTEMIGKMHETGS